jgi:hypothetical protein
MNGGDHMEHLNVDRRIVLRYSSYKLTIAYLIKIFSAFFVGGGYEISVAPPFLQ